MSPVVSCTGCGGLFPFLPRGLCADCIDLREEQFQTVREWLRDNPGSSVVGATEATGVPERTIAEFIREGRLQLASGGAPLVEDLSAREALRARLASELAAQKAQAAAPGSPAPKYTGMRTRSS